MEKKFYKKVLANNIEKEADYEDGPSEEKENVQEETNQNTKSR